MKKDKFIEIFISEMILWSLIKSLKLNSFG